MFDMYNANRQITSIWSTLTSVHNKFIVIYLVINDYFRQ